MELAWSRTGRFRGSQDAQVAVGDLENVARAWDRQDLEVAVDGLGGDALAELRGQGVAAVADRVLQDDLVGGIEAARSRGGAE